MPTMVELWTDGACSGNPGPGGWAALLRYNGRERELTGGETLTTNTRMELMAVLEGLRALKRPVEVVVHTDSAYVQRAFDDGWLERWQRNGWRTSAKKPVENRDLWEAILEAARPHTVRFERVRGHAGVELNERVDELAVEAARAAALPA
jgi:ribonuclease HI